MNDKIKAEFEKHLLNIAPFTLTKRPDGEYENDILETRWQDWRACAESKQADIKRLEARVRELEDKLRDKLAELGQEIGIGYEVKPND